MSLGEWQEAMASLETEREERPFPIREYEDRLEAVQAEIRTRNLAALIVSTPENQFYLTGYDTTGYYTHQALVVPDEGEPMFVVRSFEGPNVEIRSWLHGRKEYGDSPEGGVETAGGVNTTRDLLVEMGLEGKRVGFEEDAWYLTHRQLAALRNSMDADFVGTSGIVEDHRVVKSDRELEYIRESASIVEKGVAAAIDEIEAGCSEYDVVAELWSTLIKNGCEHVASQPYVASGTRSALPHARWKGRTIEEGDVVFFEVGAAVDRYHAAQVRSAYVGDPPRHVAAAAEAATEALTAAVDAIEPGVPAHEVDEAARTVVEEAGFGHLFPHRTGYSIGIGYPTGWGEGHIVSLGPWDDSELEPNMTFHMPIIIFLPEHGAIGCSATVQVSEGGCEPLADLDRKLFEV